LKNSANTDSGKGELKIDSPIIQNKKKTDSDRYQHSERPFFSKRQSLYREPPQSSGKYQTSNGLGEA
jgi:hypothetical protein